MKKRGGVITELGMFVGLSGKTSRRETKDVGEDVAVWSQLWGRPRTPPPLHTSIPQTRHMGHVSNTPGLPRTPRGPLGLQVSQEDAAKAQKALFYES